MEPGREQRRASWSSWPGNPGRTDRLNTVASLEYLRDVELPLRLDMLESREAFLLEYGRRSPEAFRQSKEELFTIQNSRKARVGGLEGLRDPAFMARKARDEAELRVKRSSSGGRIAGRRRRLGQDRRGQESCGPHRQAVLLPRARLCLRFRALHDCAHARAARAGEDEAEFRPPQGVS